MQRILSHYLLNDKGIREALAEGRIAISPAPSDDQFQTTSLDVRIGEVHVYSNDVREEAVERIAHKKPSSLIEGAADIDSLLEEMKPRVFMNDENTPITIPSRSYAEIYLHEKVSYSPQEMLISYALRSSRGRLILRPDSDMLRENQLGQYIGLHNMNSNDIILRGQDKIAQFFFNPFRHVPHSGKVVNNPRRVQELLPDLADLVTPEGYVLFFAGEKALTYNDLDIPYDTGFPLPKEKLFTEIDLRESYSASTQEALIVSLLPKVKMPNNVGIMLQRTWPFSPARSLEEAAQRPFRLDHIGVNAGWVDPGYEGQLNAHPMRFVTPFTLMRGLPLVCGIVYEYFDDPERAYGTDGLNSHYQGSDGATESKS